MFEFTLPSLGADMDEGTLTEWRVAPGDTVERGQVIASVDTAKAEVEVEIWRDGVVHRLLAQPGVTLPVGAAMATMLEPGEDAPPVDGIPASEAPAATPVPAPAVAAPVPAPAGAAPATRPAPAARRRISPAARRQARALGVDLDTVTGTGPWQSVTIEDVDRAAAARTAVASAAPAPPPAAAPAKTPVDKAAEMRRAIASAMGRSKREIPHYYLSEQIPLTRALDWLTDYNAQRPVTERVLLAALLIKAVALATRRCPEMSGFWTDDEFHPAPATHVGVAVSLRQGGLIAPAIHDVADLALPELMAALADLVKRARAGSLRSSEMSDPTVTVTNLGEESVESVYGVIYPPQVALVGFGKPTRRPWVDGDTVRPVSAVTATLAADHRVSDGRRGALFLTEIAELLQHPERL
ncbi:dihydrolipoamide acetyltransferase family protein [Rhodococcus ruber]|uniref:Dihydrolipoamide acetyltransferase component of pyruvate dehydrogenase complex n=2 Tax=Rhodococcus ruber TaxID=1830 RepID=A0A098BUP4_9NOCA|nr:MULTISPECIES: dihydrolipoamide acetyltransferase family protein [Rhodococcus]MBP2211910.1 pyruvate dehydrogenase E2 component (dihydrolipoamide acetyltransferase) [Rhodococcus ruber]MCD2127118.1 2-oxo acid dehydrogenase subunit E2 [Rhodococcus ruber]MCZ4503284.1 dihydrolipoamide acetyltransferase family protein [Rhodococcus ruber]MCZ4530621.1 dihydrolipoamide acetyltransferase family protein [Rhodococcus ruber]MCZ4621679.1 dihydrolipoamide acetyltransferase family protein [Rhodococcus ruber